MHEKINVRIDLSYSDDYDELHSQLILVGKNLNTNQVESATIEFLANTNFFEKNLYEFSYESSTQDIDTWLSLCREKHEELSIQYPAHDEELEIGTWKSDNRHTEYAMLRLIYERRYLENE